MGIQSSPGVAARFKPPPDPRDGASVPKLELRSFPWRASGSPLVDNTRSEEVHRDEDIAAEKMKTSHRDVSAEANRR